MEKKSLLDEIRAFQKGKKFIIPALIILGLAGIILPIIPGLAILAIAFMLIFPKQGRESLNRLRKNIAEKFNLPI